MVLLLVVVAWSLPRLKLASGSKSRTRTTTTTRRIAPRLERCSRW
jgi:hypothetical protein